MNKEQAQQLLTNFIKGDANPVASRASELRLYGNLYPHAFTNSLPKANIHEVVKAFTDGKYDLVPQLIAREQAIYEQQIDAYEKFNQLFPVNTETVYKYFARFNPNAIQKSDIHRSANLEYVKKKLREFIERGSSLAPKDLMQRARGLQSNFQTDYGAEVYNGWQDVYNNSSGTKAGGGFPVLPLLVIGAAFLMG